MLHKFADVNQEDLSTIALRHSLSSYHPSSWPSEKYRCLGVFEMSSPLSYNNAMLHLCQHAQLGPRINPVVHAGALDVVSLRLE